MAVGAFFSIVIFYAPAELTVILVHIGPNTSAMAPAKATRYSLPRDGQPAGPWNGLFGNCGARVYMI
jgi:hypothetical protein